MRAFAKSSLPKIKNTNTLEDMVRNGAKTGPEKLYLLLLGIVGLFTDPTNTDPTNTHKIVTISDLVNVFSALDVLVNEEKEEGASGQVLREVFFDIVQTLASDNALLRAYLLENPSKGTAATHARPARLS